MTASSTENGTPVTAEDVAYGIARSLDSDDVPGGPGLTTPRTTSRAATSTRAPTPTPARTTTASRSTSQDITIKMAKPFPDMDYWGSFLAIGPIPLGEGLPTRRSTATHPLSTGPYKIESLRAERSRSCLVKNDQLGPGHRPGSSPVRRQVDVQVQPTDQARSTRSMLSGNTDVADDVDLATASGSTTTPSPTSDLGDRLVQQSAQCISYAGRPDYDQDHRHQGPQGAGVRLPVRGGRWRRLV